MTTSYLGLTTIVSIWVGIRFAVHHERVLDRVTNYFNKILAFVIGAAVVSWCSLLLYSTWLWTKTPSRYRDLEDLALTWCSFLLALVGGILCIGLLTTIADIRENIRRLAQNGIQPSPKADPPKWEAVRSPAKEEPSGALPEEPEFTDEQKAELAKKMVRNAQLAAMPVGVDEETPTDP